MKSKKIAFSKTNARKLVATIKKQLKTNIITDEEIVRKFYKYLISKKIECVITNKEKIIFACGTRVRPYLNLNISDNLKKIINDDTLSDLCSIFLEIINQKRIRGLYLYKAIKTKRKYQGKNIGCIIYFYKRSNLNDILEIENNFQF